MSFVQVQHLTRTFGHGPAAVHAVKDLDFSFAKGEIFGFIGPNGAGKSTTMRILATLDLPTAGDCLVDGQSTVDDADAVRRLVGYMPDHANAYPNMTVLEYLDFFARAYDLSAERRRRQVADLLEFCQLGGIRDKQATTLSKGMAQRLALGRCLIHDPALLILDEPSAGLDPRARIEFRELLRILAGQGKAIFISSHILAELEELCHGVAIIEQGRMIATGRVAELKAHLEAGTSDLGQPGEDTGPGAPPRSGAIIEIRLTEFREDLAQRLAEEPLLSGIQLDGTRITARITGGPADHAALLRRLVVAGLPVCRFAQREADLEDLFLHVTEGKVQ